MLDSGIFTSTSGSVNSNGIFVGNKAKSASFLAEIVNRVLGDGISMNPTSSFYVAPKTGMTVTVKAGWGVKKGYTYKLPADLDITLNSSTSAQVIYIGVRLVEAAYGYSGYANDNVSAFTTFVADTDTVYARIDIPANAVTITDAMITDLRYNTTYCGFVDEFRISLQTLAADLNTLIQTIYEENGISADSLGVISFSTAQTLTTEQKAQARANAGAVGATEILPENLGDDGVAELNSDSVVTPGQARAIVQTKTSSFALGAADAEKLTLLDSTSAIVVTIPLDSTYNFPVGTAFNFLRWNTGAASFAATVGISWQAVGAITAISAQSSSALLVKVAANTWWLSCG